MNAQDLMTLNPAIVTPRATVAEVWDVMRELDIRHVPVVENNALVGMLSDRDLAQFEGTAALRDRLGTPVVKVMSSDVICVSPETALGEIVDLLIEHRIGAVPVIRPDTREVIGIVSYVDVLEALRDALEEE